MITWESKNSVVLFYEYIEHTLQMCSLEPESFEVPDTWETTWETWGEPDPARFEKERLSSQLVGKMLERACRAVLERLYQEEQTQVSTILQLRHDASYTDLVGATIVAIESHLTGDLVVQDIVYIISCWKQLEQLGQLDKELISSVLSLLTQVAEDYSETNLSQPATTVWRTHLHDPLVA